MEKLRDQTYFRCNGFNDWQIWTINFEKYELHIVWYHMGIVSRPIIYHILVCYAMLCNVTLCYVIWASKENTLIRFQVRCMFWFSSGYVCFHHANNFVSLMKYRPEHAARDSCSPKGKKNTFFCCRIGIISICEGVRVHAYVFVDLLHCMVTIIMHSFFKHVRWKIERSQYMITCYIRCNPRLYHLYNIYIIVEKGHVQQQ